MSSIRVQVFTLVVITTGVVEMGTYLYNPFQLHTGILVREFHEHGNFASD